MRTISLLHDIRSALYDLAITIPEIYLDFDVEQIELQYRDDDQTWDIVFVESEDTEIFLGTVFLDEDLNAVFDTYSEENLVDEA